MWLQSGRRDCQDRLHEREAISTRIQAAEQAFRTLHQLLQQVDESRSRLAELSNRREQLQREQRDLQVDLRQAQQQADSCSHQHTMLTELAAWTDSLEVEPPSLEGLLSDSVGKRLSAMVGELCRSFAGARWSLGWLPTSPPSDPKVNTAIIHLARQAQVAAEELEGPLFEAATLCRQPTCGVGQESRLLRELEAEKARLADSEDENDLVRLAGINRQIKSLCQDRWSILCRSIIKPLRTIFGGQLPPDLDNLTSALRPEAQLSGTLEPLQGFIAQIREACHGVLVRNAASLKTEAAADAERFREQAQQHRQQTEQAQQALDRLGAQVDTVQDTVDGVEFRIQECQERWNQVWPDACVDINENTEPPPLGYEALQNREHAFNNWQREHAAEHARHQRLQPILREWIHRLGDLSAIDRPAFRSQYVRHANVTGITCYEAGQRDFYDNPDFEPFDIVIIDEVSKATPPELLMPMLLGRKVVLVGDPRQLPPMLRENEISFADAIEEGLVQAEDFERYRQMVTASFFAGLFDTAPEALKHTLWRQYRMHPQIMEVVNQFYGGQLIDGFGEEQYARAV